jgi:hypothetical protein
MSRSRPNIFPSQYNRDTTCSSLENTIGSHTPIYTRILDATRFMTQELGIRPIDLTKDDGTIT